MFWCGLVLILIVVVVWRRYTYWTRNGFPEIVPSFPFGNFSAVATRKKALGVQIHDLYFQSQSAILGIYLFFKPALLIRDPLLIKRVLIRDFEYFCDRGVHYDEENDPLGANLFGMPLVKWKKLREKLTPIFTGSKLRNMLPIVEEKVHILRDHLKGQVNQVVDLKTIVSYSNVNTIASIFFGLELNCFETPDHEFRLMGEQFLSTATLRNVLVQALFFVSPPLMKFLKLSLMPPEVSAYILNLMPNIFEMRRKEKLQKNDLIKIFMAMMDAEENDPTMDPADKMTITRCAAESFVFYIAGSETSAAAISFCIYELSRQPDLIDTLRQEFDPIMEEFNGNVPYEKLKELKFLNMCVTETLRKYPGLPLLSRQCMKDYKIPETELTIKKGTPIIISNFAIQNDPKYYPDPSKFDPYRFKDDDKATETPYLPWGGGPRSCIGIRLGNIIVKMAVINLIYHFDFISKSQVEYDPKALLLTDINNVQMYISERNRKQ